MICRIINVEVRVIEPKARLITLSKTLIILHITKTESNNCFIIHFQWKELKNGMPLQEFTENLENFLTVLFCCHAIPHTIIICIVGSTCR